MNSKLCVRIIHFACECISYYVIIDMIESVCIQETSLIKDIKASDEGYDDMVHSRIVRSIYILTLQNDT